MRVMSMTPPATKKAFMNVPQCKQRLATAIPAADGGGFRPVRQATRRTDYIVCTLFLKF
jgi:hypothetical protein